MNNYQATINNVFEAIGVKYSDFTHEFVEDVFKNLRSTGLGSFFERVYIDVYAVDYDDIALGYAKDHNNENDRVYDLDWVYHQLIDDDTYQPLYDQFTNNSKGCDIHE